MSAKPPCQRCGKPVAKAYSSWLSGTWICRSCVKADPKIQQRLSPKALATLKKGLKTIALIMLSLSLKAHADPFSFFKGGCYEPNHNIYVNQKLDKTTYGMTLPDVIDHTVPGVTRHAVLMAWAPIPSDGWLVGIYVRHTGKQITVKLENGFDEKVDVWEQCKERTPQPEVHRITHEEYVD